MRARGGLLVVGVLAILAATGCLGSEEAVDPAAAPANGTLNGSVELLEDGGFQVTVPTDVVLVGFEPDVAPDLQASLDPEEVRHLAHSNERAFPPGSEDPVPPEQLPVPLVPEVRYEVSRLDEEATQTFFQAVEEQQLEPGVYDANAAEEQLARLLPQDGIGLDEDTPSLVVLHAGDRLGDDHAWRFTYENGHLEPVRAFGETTPMLVYDVSAQPDPFVVGEEAQGDVEAYNFELEAGGQQTAAHLRELVVDATHYRLAKGSTFPVTTRACHHVQLLVAVHETALTETAPGYRDATNLVDVDRLEAAFGNATGDEVHTDLTVLRLPQDDPGLDAVTRRSQSPEDDYAGGFLGGEGTQDPARWYLDENWERYVDAPEGCEEYLSLLVVADASPGCTCASGSGHHNVATDRRITISVVDDIYRLLSEPEDGQDEVDIVNYLLSHETGHILGLHHPHSLIRAEGGSYSNDAFQSVRSVMSYQTGDRTVEFSVLDRAQLQRSRAGYIVQEALEQGLDDTDAFAEALDAAAESDWAKVQAALDDAVDHDEVTYGSDEAHAYATSPALLSGGRAGASS